MIALESTWSLHDGVFVLPDSDAAAGDVAAGAGGLTQSFSFLEVPDRWESFLQPVFW